jgi:hypothetical protein
MVFGRNTRLLSYWLVPCIRSYLLWQDRYGEKSQMATKLTNAIIEAAIDGFESQKQRLDEQIAALRAMLTGATEQTTAEVSETPKRRKISAAGRKRMKEAQRLRWAKIRGESETAAVKTPVKNPRPKPKFSAEARKALSIAMKKRWAAKKAA